MDSIYYVYVKFRPRDGSPCYVGKGCGGRAWDHDKYDTGNQHLQRIIKKVGGPIPTVIFREELTEQEAYDLEKILIKAIGRACDGGPLCNMTDGGEGMSAGYVPSEETRKKQSEGLRLYYQSEVGTERKRRQSEERLGKEVPEHIKKAMSEGVKRRYQDPLQRERTSAALKARWKALSPEEKEVVREKMLRAQAILKEDPSWNTRVAETLKKRLRDDPDVLEKQLRDLAKARQVRCQRQARG